MTATAAAAKAAHPYPCPEPGCTYSMDTAGSVPAHLAMVHKVEMVGRRPEEAHRCIGSNHVPGCAHFPMAPEVPPASGATTTDSSGGEGPAQSGPVSETTGHALLADIYVLDNVREDLGDLGPLAASIAAHGLLQPLLVQSDGDGYVLVDGHRRLAAAVLAGLDEVPVHVAPGELLTGGARKGVQVEANAHRRELNALEIAQAYRDELADGTTQAELARRHGVAAPTIANALRLLEAAPRVQELLRAGSITAAHAKAVLGLPVADQERMATQAAELGSSAHQLESDAAYLRKLEADRKAKAKANVAAAKHAVTALVEAGVPAGARVAVSVPWDMDGRPAKAAVAEAGWSVLETPAWGERDDACGCGTWRVACEGGKSAKAEPVCFDDGHRDARREARDRKRQEAEQARKVENQQLRGALLEVLPGLGPTLLRVLLRRQENYNGTTWAEYGKLDTAEVVKRLASGIVLGYGEKPIPTAAVVEALRAEAVR